MKKITITTAAVGLALALSACGASTTPDGADPNALPQAETTSAPATSAPATTPAETTEPASKVSTCDVVREAFLTGSPAEITKALKALKADKTADATAREYADYYLNRDKGQPDLQEMDKTLIQTSCSM